MKYKITEISTDNLKVEYNDGTWAVIPNQKSWTKNDYLKAIKNYCNVAPEPVPVVDNPMKLGDEGTVGEGITADPEPEPASYSYDMTRLMLYPSLEVQADATYRARKGDSSHVDKLDIAIELVKSKVPIDINKKYTHEEYEALQKEIVADAKWYDG